MDIVRNPETFQFFRLYSKCELLHGFLNIVFNYLFSMEGFINLIHDDHGLLIKIVHDNCSCIVPVDQGCSCGFLVGINMRHNTNNKTVPFRSS